MEKVIKQQRRWKKYRNEKELKRFDPKRDFLRSNRNDLLSDYIL